MKKNQKINKSLLGLLLIIFYLLGTMNIAQASNIESANLYSIGDCGQLLTYKGIIVKVSYVEYLQDGIHYPAYCLDKTKPGAETQEYSVSIQNAIQDVGLWRRIINGYPYKTIEELGVANKEEAFTATKQAVYCYIHGNNPDDYGAIGEAGQRTLNALHKIIENAENSKEVKISSTITINKENSKGWAQDKIDKNYVSKLYSVSAGAPFETYKVILTKDGKAEVGGIKLTDEKNQEKTEFSKNEKFKIMIPIKNMTQKGSIELQIKTKVNTKPILYGKAPDSGYQDYAVTTATYEDGEGSLKEEYSKNETKITIVKKDKENEKTIEGVEFQILNNKKEIVYTGLKTDKNGKIKIENIIPGTYYLKEVKAQDGYIENDKLVKIEVDWNQEVTVTIHNQKEEIETEKVTKKYEEVTNKKVKKLPVTGM